MRFFVALLACAVQAAPMKDIKPTALAVAPTNVTKSAASEPTAPLNETLEVQQTERMSPSNETVKTPHAAQAAPVVAVVHAAKEDHEVAAAKAFNQSFLASSTAPEECGDSLADSTCASRKESCDSGRDSAQCNRCVYIIHCLGQKSYSGTCFGKGVYCGYAWGRQWGTWCFPSSSTVQILSADDTVTTGNMVDLKVGDKVLTANGFSEVYAFMDHTTETKSEYLKLKTESGAELRLTEEHILFAHEDRQPVLAKEVKEGDFLWVAAGSSATDAEAAQLTLSRVMEVAREIAVGAHAPLTADGSVVVDGVLASSYASAQTLRWGESRLISGHKLNSLLHAPLRFACKLSPSMCGPEWHSADLGRHVWTQWVLDNFGWLQKINLEHYDLQAEFRQWSFTAWAAASVQVLAALVLLVLDAAVFSFSPGQLVAVLILLCAQRGHRWSGRKQSYDKVND